MNTKLFFIFLALSSFVLFNTSCKKKLATYDLSGQIYDPQLKQNVSSARVSLKASKIESGVYNPNYVEIMSTSSSSNGQYSFTVEHDNVSGYRLDFTKDNYFDYSTNIKTEDVQNEAGFKVNIELIPEALIKLSVNNTSPQGTDDEILFRFKNINVKCKECWNNESIIGVGPTYSYSETKKASGAKDIYIEWVVKKNGQQHIYQDTIHSKAFDTVNYNINY